MSKPKVLFFDVETSALETKERKWGLWDERPIKREVTKDYQILTVAWHWYGEMRRGKHVVYVIGQDDLPGYVPGQIDDLELLREFHKVISEAQYVVAHNGDTFDMKKLRARMVLKGLPPFPAPKQYDTLKAAKRVGKFTSNRLGDLARDFGVDEKGDPGGFETWEGCENGDPKSWRHMKRYNKADIPPMIGVYDRLTPWDKQAPDLNVLADMPDACTRCLGRVFELRGLTIPTKTGTRRQRYQCKAVNCGKWLQGRNIIRSDVQLVS
jgi:hypothetical protein